MRYLIALCVLCFLPGCIQYKAFETIDKMMAMAERIEMRRMELEAEARKQTDTIEGVVVKTEMVEKIISVKLDADSKREIEELKKQIKELDDHPNVEFKGDLPETEKTVKVCVVTFEDGREKEFAKVPAKPFVKGDYYIIEYNGMDEITMVTRDKNERPEEGDAAAAKQSGQDTGEESEVGNP